MVAVIAGGVQAAADDDLPDLVKALIRSTMQAHAANPKLRRAIIEELPRIGRPARIAELKRGIHPSIGGGAAERPSVPHQGQGNSDGRVPDHQYGRTSRMWRKLRATMPTTSRAWSASSTIWFWRISWRRGT